MNRDFQAGCRMAIDALVWVICATTIAVTFGPLWLAGMAYRTFTGEEYD